MNASLRPLLACALLLGVLAPTRASAQTTLNLCSVLTNISFESGTLAGWTLTAPNGDYILTPTGVNPVIDPTIDPADPANNPAVLTAPAGIHFTGVKQIGDTAINLKYKLSHDATAISVAPGTSVQVTVWANRGRLEPFDTPVTTGDLLVRIFGWTGSTSPTVSTSDNWTPGPNWNPAAQTFNFTGVPDGTWASQTFTFVVPTTMTLTRLSMSIAGRNNNHDQYIAVDLCDGPTATEAKTWGSIKHHYR
jgi:hypothetical protein